MNLKLFLWKIVWNTFPTRDILNKRFPIVEIYLDVRVNISLFKYKAMKFIISYYLVRDNLEERNLKIQDPKRIDPMKIAKNSKFFL
jgi:hypothetical protein